jgi:hypothetical protein
MYVQTQKDPLSLSLSLSLSKAQELLNPVFPSSASNPNKTERLVHLIPLPQPTTHHYRDRRKENATAEGCADQAQI